MITLLKHFLASLLWDEKRAERWIRGLGNAGAGMFSAVVLTVLPYASDANQMVGVIKGWTLGDWGWRAGVGLAWFLANARAGAKVKEAKP